MAKVNGKTCTLLDVPLEKIGDKIIPDNINRTGAGIVLELNDCEESMFGKTSMDVAFALVGIIASTIERRGYRRPKGPHMKYHPGRYETY